MDDLSESIANTGSLPGAPPPPPEVKVRTMRSDLESMAKSGGGLPHFQNVEVSGLALERVAADANPRKKSQLLTAIVIVVVLLALGAGAYFAYKTFLPGSSPSSQTPSQQLSPAPTAPPQTSPSAVPAAVTTPVPAVATAFTHSSFFKKAPDQTLVVTFLSGGAVQSASDLQTYSQRIIAALTSAAAKPASILTEINAKASDGHDLSATQLLAQAGASVIDPAVLAGGFNPDVTMFVYHDKNDFWPGYILTLNSGETPAMVSANIKKLEFSPSVSNFFLASEGTPSAGGFKDSTVSGLPARQLSFSGNPSAVFTYGWFGNYLILSSSPAGFSAAVIRLQ